MIEAQGISLGLYHLHMGLAPLDYLFPLNGERR